MNFELFIALRYIFALRRQSYLGIISLFAVCGVALGVAALIVVIGVMNGFTKDLRDKILGSMSARAAAAIVDEIEAKGPMRVTEVQEAQKQIIAVARRLSDAGQMVLAGRGDDYV